MACVSLLWCLLVLYLSLNSVDGGRMTTIDRLYNSVFTNYSTKTLPVLDHLDTAIVHITANAININAFDEMSGELALTMTFTFMWRERRISWNASDYGFLTSLPVLAADIWRPQVYLLQSTGTADDLAESAVRARLFHNGTVVWNTGNVIKVACAIDVKYFPFDTQTCDVTLLDWVLTDSELKFLPGKSSVQVPLFNRNSRWELRPSTLTRCQGRRMEKIPCLSLRFVLKRRSEFYVVYILVPLTLLGLTNNVVFLMPSSGDRMSVAMTIFLSFVVYMNIVNDIVPQSSAPMAYVYSYILYLLLYSSVSVFLCVISLRVYNKKTQVPRYIETLIWYARLRFLCLRSPQKGHIRMSDIDLPGVQNPAQLAPGSVTGESLGKRELSTSRNEITSVAKSNKESRIKYHVTWDVVGKTYDFYCCLILSFVFLVISSYTFSNLWRNKGLHSVA